MKNFRIRRPAMWTRMDKISNIDESLSQFLGVKPSLCVLPTCLSQIIIANAAKNEKSRCYHSTNPRETRQQILKSPISWCKRLEIKSSHEYWWLKGQNSPNTQNIRAKQNIWQVDLAFVELDLHSLMFRVNYLQCYSTFQQTFADKVIVYYLMNMENIFTDFYFKLFECFMPNVYSSH